MKLRALHRYTRARTIGRVTFRSQGTGRPFLKPCKPSNRRRQAYDRLLTSHEVASFASLHESADDWSRNLRLDLEELLRPQRRRCRCLAVQLPAIHLSRAP